LCLVIPCNQIKHGDLAFDSFIELAVAPKGKDLLEYFHGKNTSSYIPSLGYKSPFILSTRARGIPPCFDIRICS